MEKKLKDMSEDELFAVIERSNRDIVTANKVIAQCMNILKGKRTSESVSSSSAAVSPKTPRLAESEESDDDDNGPILVRKTVKCGLNCGLCPFVFEGESLPNMLYPHRPLRFKDHDQPFHCNFPAKGVYCIICTNPTCPQQYHGPLYFGQSGKGRKSVKDRMNNHIGASDIPETAGGVDSHFTGDCKLFMRFIFMKEVKDDKERLKKETKYMHLFGTLDPVRGMNGAPSYTPHPSKTKLCEDMEGETTGWTAKITPRKKRVKEVHWQIPVAECLMQMADHRGSSSNIANFIMEKHPIYTSSYRAFVNLIAKYLSNACANDIPTKPLSSTSSDWFKMYKKGKRGYSKNEDCASIYELKDPKSIADFEKDYEKGLIDLAKWEEENASQKGKAEKSYLEKDSSADESIDEG